MDRKWPTHRPARKTEPLCGGLRPATPIASIKQAIHMSDKPGHKERIAAMASRFTSIGEHVKVPTDLNCKVVHQGYELSVDAHEDLGRVVQESANQIRDQINEGQQ